MLTRYLFPCTKSYLSPLWKTADSLKLLEVSERVPSVQTIEAVRYRARKGYRAKELAAKKARKLKEATKPQATVPKYLQRKVKVSAELERKKCTDENWLKEQPIDNVYNMKLYRGKPYPVFEALKILKDLHMPSMLNDPSALVYLTTELDLNLKKKNKFMDEFSGILTYPHEFETAKKNRIIAICKESEDQMKATDAGAIYAGSTALIKQILSGTLAKEDFDYVICHPDMYKELNSLRGILKRKFPNTNNGLLRLDIDRAVATFLKGVEYSLKHSAIEPDFGWVDVCIGRLNMPFEHIEENLKHALNTIEKVHKPAGTNHILFMIRTLLWCEKSRERLKIPHWEYLPNYPENGILIDEGEDSETQAETAA